MREGSATDKMRDSDLWNKVWECLLQRMTWVGVLALIVHSIGLRDKQVYGYSNKFCVSKCMVALNNGDDR